MTLANHSDTIRMLASDLMVGESSGHIKCPFCSGGTTNEPSFKISRIDTGVLYYCHRASCAQRGFCPSLRSEWLKTGERKKKPTPKPYKGWTLQLPDRVKYWLRDKYCLTFEQINREMWRWNPETQRVIMPIRNAAERVIGHNARYWKTLDNYINHSPGPKAIAYWPDAECAKYHMPLKAAPFTTDTLVLVEDMVSALRLSSVVDTVALLGVHMTEDVAYELHSAGYSRIVVCLDNDATRNAVALRDKYVLFWDKFDVTPLKGPDIKDMSQQEFDELKEQIMNGA